MFADYQYKIICSQTDLEQLSQKISRNDCTRFLRSLGLEFSKVRYTERNFEERKIRQMLIKWRQREGANATKERIIRSLRRINRIDVAMELFPGCWNEPRLRLEMIMDRISRRLRDINLTIELPQAPWMEKIHPIDELFVDLEMSQIVENFEEEPMELDDFFADVDGKKPLRILVEGGPGSGKSSFCLKLLSDWRNQKKYIASKFKMIFLFDMRYYTTSDTIDEVFMKECELPEFTGDEAIECLKAYEHETLLVMDAYDEINEKCKETVLPFLQMKDYPSMALVVTSRTGMLEFGPKTKSTHSKIPSWDKRILLKRVPQDKLYDFYKIYLGNEFSYWENKLNSLMTESLRELYQCPLFLMLLGVLLEDKAIEKSSSMTSIYKRLLNFAIRRNLIRDRVIKNSGTAFDLFSKTTENFLDNLQFQRIIQFGQLALKKVYENNLIFEEREIFNSCGGDDFVFKLGLLTKTVKIHRHQKQNYFQSIHKSFLEFIAAFAIANLFDTKPDEIEMKLVEISQKLQPTNDCHFYIFLAGFMNSNAHILIDFLHRQFGFKIQNPYLMNILLQIEDVSSFYRSFEPSLKSFFPSKHSISRENITFFQSQIHSCILKYALENNTIHSLEWDTNVFINLSYDLTVENLQIIFCNGKISKDFLRSRRKKIKCKNLECKLSQRFNLENWSDLLSCIDAIETEKTIFRIIPPFQVDDNVISHLWKELHLGYWKRKKDKSIIYSSSSKTTRETPREINIHWFSVFKTPM